MTILKVNLESQDVDVIKMDIHEKDKNYGCSGDIKTWLHNFANCGIVHEEDVEMCIEKMNPSVLRTQFLNDKNKVVKLYYRRKIGDSYHKVMMEIIPKILIPKHSSLQKTMEDRLEKEIKHLVGHWIIQMRILQAGHIICFFIQEILLYSVM